MNMNLISLSEVKKKKKFMSDKTTIEIYNFLLYEME